MCVCARSPGHVTSSSPNESPANSPLARHSMRSNQTIVLYPLALYQMRQCPQRFNRAAHARPRGLESTCATSLLWQLHCTQTCWAYGGYLIRNEFVTFAHRYHAFMRAQSFYFVRPRYTCGPPLCASHALITTWELPEATHKGPCK